MQEKHRCSGFTLPELLLVAVILGYSLSVVLLTFINGARLNEASRNLTTATIHAEYIMENLKNTAFFNLATDINNGSWTWNTATISSKGLTALKNENISTIYTGANPLDISVTVRWQGTQGRNRAKILRTLISD